MQTQMLSQNTLLPMGKNCNEQNRILLHFTFLHLTFFSSPLLSLQWTESNVNSFNIFTSDHFFLPIASFIFFDYSFVFIFISFLSDSLAIPSTSTIALVRNAPAFNFYFCMWTLLQLACIMCLLRNYRHIGEILSNSQTYHLFLYCIVRVYWKRFWVQNISTSSRNTHFLWKTSFMCIPQLFICCFVTRAEALTKMICFWSLYKNDLFSLFFFLCTSLSFPLLFYSFSPPTIMCWSSKLHKRWQKRRWPMRYKCLT